MGVGTEITIIKEQHLLGVSVVLLNSFIIILFILYIVEKFCCTSLLHGTIQG